MLNWKNQTLLIGALIGSLTGLVAAYIIIKRAEETEQQPKITTSDGVKLSLGVVGLLRLISELSSPRQR